jgi:histidinol-phosphate aminotransferase
MSRFIRPHIASMAGYVPGEQPQDGVYIKLNTNENPYPPSPAVKEALTSAVTDRLRLYPDPVGKTFREAVARLHSVEPDMVLAGNGSDDLLTIITRSFVGPGDLVAYPTPSYLLYSTLTRLQDGREKVVPFERDWSIHFDQFTDPAVKLVFLANPNSPSGTALSREEVARLAGKLSCPLVVDEAYADFAAPEYRSIDLVHNHPNVIVTRSFSKGYGLAGIRLGYLIAQAPLVEQLVKVKDSYNCDMLSLAAGTAAIEDQAYLNETRAKVVATRKRLTKALVEMGYSVPDSQTNFVWASGGRPARPTFEHLKANRVLVRYMAYAGFPDGIRISIGTDAEIDRLLEVLKTEPEAAR